MIEPGIVLCLSGCPTLDRMGYNGLTCDAFPSEAAWRQAVAFRARTLTRLALVSDNIKQVLANGEPVIVGMILGANFPGYTPTSSEGVNNGVLYRMIGLHGNHAMAVVGYDDNKSYYDGTATRKGAFRLVNSWGAAWGDHGYVWISYDCLTTTATTFDVLTLEDRVAYAPTLLASVRVRHPMPSLLTVAVIKGDYSAPAWVGSIVRARYSHVLDWLPLHATNGGASDSARFDGAQSMILDLSDAHRPGDPLENWRLFVQDDYGGADSTTASIAYFALEPTSGPIRVSSDTPKATRDPNATGGPADAAPLGIPEGIALSPSGQDVFVAEWSQNRVRRIDSTGRIFDFMGNGLRQLTGDGGSPRLAATAQPSDVAFDSTGNMYVLQSDAALSALRRVDLAGATSTVLTAPLAQPMAMDGDSSGALYVANTGAGTVLKRKPNGVVTLFAGNGATTSTGDGGPAVSASLYLPLGVAWNPVDGALYVAESHGAIRRVGSQRNINTYVRSDYGAVRKIRCDSLGNLYFTASSGAGVAGVSRIYGKPMVGPPVFLRETPGASGHAAIDVSASGDLFLALDNTQSLAMVARIDPAGALSRVAGIGKRGYGVPVIVGLSPRVNRARVAWSLY